MVAVGCWIFLTHLLGVYFRHFGTFNKTYGTLGAAIALMVWLYWTGFALLVGAELNAELAKQRIKLRKRCELQSKRVELADVASGVCPSVLHYIKQRSSIFLGFKRSKSPSKGCKSNTVSM